MTDYQRGQQDIINKLIIHIEAAVAMGMMPDPQQIVDLLIKEQQQLLRDINDPFKEIKK